MQPCVLAPRVRNRRRRVAETQVRQRKDLPLVDVKATGGLRDTNTLLTRYQQTDEASMLRVMETVRKLRSVG